MLSKCANPSCPTLFRYLHEGKLYVLGPRDAVARHKPRCSAESGHIEYAWLCSSCCLYLTIQVDEEFGTRVVRKVDRTGVVKSGGKADASTRATGA